MGSHGHEANPAVGPAAADIENGAAPARSHAHHLAATGSQL